MGLESATFISDLVNTNPLGTDAKAQGDDHLRLIKSVLQNTFPNIDAAITPTPTEINQLATMDGSTISTAQWAGVAAATTFGISLWDDANAAAARTTLGLGSLATQSTINGGDWSGTDLAVGDGGTGSSTASGARTNLGLGSLATLNTVNNGNWSGTDLAVANGGTGASNAATARSNLGAQVANGSLDTYISNSLTASELQQLQNIGANTISASQWSGLGSLDQSLSTTDDVEFNRLVIAGGTSVGSLIVDQAWTPGLSFGGGTTGITYSTRSGQYARIGSLFICHGTITLSNKGSSSGIARITGFPANVPADTTGVVLIEGGGSGIGGNIMLDVDGAADSAVPLRTQGASGDANLNDTNFTNSTDLSFLLIFHD